MTESVFTRTPLRARLLQLSALILLWINAACAVQPPAPTPTPTPPPATLTVTPTLTPTLTATITPSATPTQTATPTALPTLDPAVGPLILIVAPEDDPLRLEQVLAEAVARNYQFADFSNFFTFPRPFIVIFDNVRLAGVSENQVRLIEALEAYGSGVLAVNSLGRESGGVEYLKTMFETKGWEFAIQGNGYEDISNYAINEFLPYVGYVQIKSQGRVYPSTGFYPRVWVTPYGIYNETVLRFIDNHNIIFTEPRMQILNSPGLMYVVTAHARISYQSVTGPVEFYPSIRLAEFDFAAAPY
ncbi:MAG: hypothetical protein ROW48_17065 [Bellilinea sp.]|jgi:hypothetical protein